MNVLLCDNINVGYNSPVCIIAEIGQNHNGCIKNAKKLIDMAKKAGIKLVKFQKRDIETEFTREAYNKPYLTRNSFGKIYGEHRNFLELSEKEHLELKKYTEKQDMIYFCTPCDIPSLKILQNIGCPFYKVASRDITNIPLLKELGKIKKTVIISTGMATYEDIDLALDTLNLPNNKVIIMQCTSQYPCDIKNCHLNCIETLKHKYNRVIGYSDHTEGTLAAILSVTKGAAIIEKHITLDKKLKGSDQKGSATFEELKYIQRNVLDIPIYMGNKEKVISCPKETMDKLMKSLTTNKDIKKDDIIQKEDICLKCPGGGIKWKYINLVCGKKVKQDIAKDVTISFDMIY